MLSGDSFDSIKRDVSVEYALSQKCLIILKRCVKEHASHNINLHTELNKSE